MFLLLLQSAYQQIKDFLWFLNPNLLIDYFLGVFGIYAYFFLFLVIFAETGLAVGFLLPGDSFLVVAGLLAAAGKLNIYLLLASLFLGSVIGDSTGYLIGSRMGNRLFSNPDSKIFRPAYVNKAREFFDRYGAKTIVLARFVPIVRTFAPLVAGAAGMSYQRFLPYSILGSFLWIFGLTLTGYFLGTLIEESVSRFFGIEFKLVDHIEKVIFLIVGLSLLPPIIEWIKSKFGKRKVGEGNNL